MPVWLAPAPVPFQRSVSLSPCPPISLTCTHNETDRRNNKKESKTGSASGTNAPLGCKEPRQKGMQGKRKILNKAKGNGESTNGTQLKGKGEKCQQDLYCIVLDWMGLDWMGWDGIGWDWMGLDWIGLDGMGWDGMGWDGMGWDGMGWDGMGWDGIELDWMGWDGMGWDGMGLDWIGLDGMGWDGIGWDGIHCIGWDGM